MYDWQVTVSLLSFLFGILSKIVYDWLSGRERGYVCRSEFLEFKRDITRWLERLEQKIDSLLKR